MTTNAQSNRRIVLAARPRTAADLSCFRLEAVPIDAPREGEILLRTLWLSLDPYMRGRMSDAPSYAPPVAIGGVMTGGTVARVEKSLNANFRVGELVLATSGWQEFAISDGSDLVKLPANMDSPSQALGVLGMPSFTAASETAIVELTSPTTRTRSGWCSIRTGSTRSRTSAVCAAWEPEPTSRLTCGVGIPICRKKMSERASS